MSIVLSPFSCEFQSVIHGGWVRTTPCAEVVIVTDGSQVGHQIGYAAVILDGEGVLGHFWGHSEVFDASSWVAEWFAKLLGVCMVAKLGKRFFMIADNLSIHCFDGVQKHTGS
eukprot:EG_transcript_56664